MISPAWLSGCTDAIRRLCAETEQSILDDMARRLAAYDFYIPAAQYQEEKLKLLGASRGVIRRELARRTQKAEAEIARLMQEGARQSLKNSGYLYEAAGKTPPKHLSAGMKSLLLSAYRQTAGTFQNLTRTTAKTAVGELEHALDLAWMQVSLGAMDPKSAVKGAVKRLADAGLSAVTYPSGHTDSLTTAVTRAVRTGVNQGAIRLQEELARELGTDLVEVTAHAGARPEHALWQGKIYSLSGKTPGYEKLSDATGYGTGAGLGGWNCRHSFFPYVEGSPNATPKELLEQYENEAFLHYRGKALTQSEADRLKSRIQNRLGKWQREESMLRAAGLETGEAAAKVREWETEKRTFEEAYAKAQNILEESKRKYGDFGFVAKLQDGVENLSESDIIKAKIIDAKIFPKEAIVHVPPREIDVEVLKFDDKHVNIERERNITREETVEWIKNAKCSVTVWGGQYERYYSLNGAVYVRMKDLVIRTAFAKNDFIGDAEKVRRIMDER